MPLRLLDIAVIVSTLIILVFNRVDAYRRKCKSVGNMKIVPFPFGPFQVPNVILPTCSWNTGLLYTWWNRDTLYDGLESRTFAVVPFLFGTPWIHIGSLEVLKQVNAPRAPFDRPLFHGLVENVPQDTYNVATAQRETWLRHRRVVNPAFNQNVYRAVWAEAIRTFQEMVSAENWQTLSTVQVPDMPALTAKLTLAIIAMVGFGFELPWADGKSEGGKLTMREAFKIVAEGAILRSAVPEWTYFLPIRMLRDMKAALDKLLESVRLQIDGRRTALPGEGAHLFNLLLKANDSEAKASSLSDKELISNIFVMLFAGHETSSKALACTFGLLACHPDEQEKLNEHIRNALGDRVPSFEDYDSLQPVVCFILEALRLFPIAPLMNREVMETATLKLPGLQGPTVLEKGVFVCGDIIGMNYDPVRFPSPHVFCPSRWASGPGVENSFSFGLGEHACIGRKFALFELVCLISLFVRTWRVMREGENAEDPEKWRKRWLEGTMKLGITMGPEKMPLRLERR